MNSFSQGLRDHMERVRICISCHKDLADGNFLLKAIFEAGEMLNMNPHSDKEHSKLLNKTIKISALVQIILSILTFALIVFYI